MTDRETLALPEWEPSAPALPADVIAEIFRLRDAGRQMETIPLLEEALKEGSPVRDNSNFWHALAFIHADGQQFEQSKLAFWEIIKRATPHPVAYLELCQALMACGEWNDALLANECAMDLLAAEPLHNDRKIQATINAAALAYRFGRPARGASLYGAIARIKDPAREVQFAVGMARLTTHHDRLAWTLHERRLDTVGVYKWSADRGETPLLPAWEKGAQGPVVFWQEQGAGDLLMMLRYLPAIAASSGHPVIVRADPPLWPIIRAMPGVGAILARTDEPPQRALWQLPILSAPYAFGVDGWEDVPPPVIPEAWAWRRPDGAPVIGLCWQGASGHPGDKDRSAPVESLEKLRRLLPFGVPVQALQPGPVPEWMTPLPPVADYGGTADVMRAMRVVITVDTSVFHLSGTLGVPTWLVPPCGPEWRHGLSGKTPWYPKVRVVRRKEVSGWPSAWRAVAKQVTDYLEARER